MDVFSQSGVCVPRLDESVQVFLIPLSPTQDLRQLPLYWLDAQETQTAQGFVNERDCRLYTLAHLWLRYLLGQACGEMPQALRIVRAEHGKPRLADAGKPVFFSLSHTHSCIAIALSAGGELGVDIERLDPALDVQALQDLVLHPDERAQQVDTPHFFRLWTLKEAYAKALGLGVGLPFARLAMTITPEGKVTCRDESGAAAVSPPLQLLSRSLSIDDATGVQAYALGLAAMNTAPSPRPVALHIVDNPPPQIAPVLRA